MCALLLLFATLPDIPHGAPAADVQTFSRIRKGWRIRVEGMPASITSVHGISKGERINNIDAAWKVAITPGVRASGGLRLVLFAELWRSRIEQRP